MSIALLGTLIVNFRDELAPMAQRCQWTSYRFIVMLLCSLANRYVSEIFEGCLLFHLTWKPGLVQNLYGRKPRKPLPGRDAATPRY
jgi:hypothetical protein